MLKVRHLSYNFGQHWALKNCCFSLQKGDFLFLSGPSGAGKTTLLKVLYAALPVTRGEVEVAGFSLNRLKSDQVPDLRRKVSVVFQDFKIMPERSVYENVALPLEVRGLPPQSIERRVRAVCKGLGLERCVQMPCASLSGGEQQRVAVARALANAPSLILADEPTAALDGPRGHQVMELFSKVAHERNAAVLVVTHDHRTLDVFDRILDVEDGMIQVRVP